MALAPADDADDEWTYTINKYHQAYVVDCMKFFEGRHYPKDAVFTRAQLMALKPKDICRWLKNRAYGKPDITDDDRPTQRAGTLGKARDGVSACHPNSHIRWTQDTHFLLSLIKASTQIDIETPKL